MRDYKIVIDDKYINILAKPPENFLWEKEMIFFCGEFDEAINFVQSRRDFSGELSIETETDFYDRKKHSLIENI